MSAVENKVNIDDEINKLLKTVENNSPNESEFYQAVEEVIKTLKPLFEKENKYLKVLQSIIEPERSISFRINWTDDNGNERVNRGYRVQFNSAIGPYKGGLRFHPSVNLSIIKFLGFEQIFKNALTGLPMGGGKGGSNFNPKGCSDNEVKRFCQSFMTELYRHIGSNTDVPAGDIGVGGREIGYLLGQYKRITKLNDSGVLTGKQVGAGGSNIRTEATGYGLIYFTVAALMDKHNTTSTEDILKNKICLVSGSGNVAQHAVEKLISYGAKVVTMSDSGGYIYEAEGFTTEQLNFIKDLKNEKRGRISEYVDFSKSSKYYENEKPWNVKCDYAFPCATQNELDLDDMKKLVENGCSVVAEGANMPTYTDAIHYAQKSNVLFLPAKAANAGGVGVSGLEMSQNSLRYFWTREEVDEKLHNMMTNLYKRAKSAAEEYGKPNDIVFGANAAGFKQVADAMLWQGYA